MYYPILFHCSYIISLFYGNYFSLNCNNQIFLRVSKAGIINKFGFKKYAKNVDRVWKLMGFL